MQAAQRSALGIAKDGARGQLTASVAVSGTSLVLTSVVGTFTSSGFVTIYSGPDGGNTETLAVSAWTGGSSTLTVAAATKAHDPGDLVVVTAAANAPADFIPVTDLQQNDNITFLEDQGYRGSMTDVYGVVEGPRHGEFDLGGAVFPDTFGYLLAAILGDVVTTGSSAPYTHVMSALNSGNGQPPSLTLTDVEPVQARAAANSMVTDLSIKIDAQQLLTYTAKVISFASGKVAQPTQSYSGVTPLAAWTGSTSIGGTYTPRLDSGQIDIKRNGTVQNTVQGNRQPYKIWDGPLSVTGKLTLVYEDESDITQYLNHNQPALVLDFLQGAAAGLTEVTLQMSKANYTAAAKNRGKDMITAEVSFTAIANTTDAGASGGYSPIKATVKSAKPASTYA